MMSKLPHNLGLATSCDRVPAAAGVDAADSCAVGGVAARCTPVAAAVWAVRGGKARARLSKYVR